MEIIENDFINNIDNIENYYNKIIHGDCLSVMQKMPSKSIDIIITSPPYNLLNSTGNGLKKNTNCGKWKNAAIKHGYNDYSDNMPYDKYIEWQQKCVNEMYRLIKDDGAIFYNNKNRVQGGVLQDRREILKDVPVRQIIIWKRCGAINFNAGYFLPTTEQIYLVCNKDFKLTKGANKWTDVWEIKQEMKNPHPAPFPEELTDRIIQSTTGQIILDPFGGSGTTAVSSIKNNRNFILIEKSEIYCKMSKLRLEGNEDWKNAENYT
ncbi:MAG: DNA-methyltransferase [Eubacteriales bacterium]